MEQEKYFRSADDTELFYRYCPAKDASCDKAIVLFHRGHEHSGRMMFVAEELGFDDFAYFAWDARGHGLSPGERGDSPLPIFRHLCSILNGSMASRRKISA